MKVNIMSYEIELKAKSVLDDRYNKETTLEFLNELVLMLRTSGENAKNSGHINAARMFIKNANDLHEILDENNFYNEVK